MSKRSSDNLTPLYLSLYFPKSTRAVPGWGGLGVDRFGRKEDVPAQTALAGLSLCHSGDLVVSVSVCAPCHPFSRPPAQTRCLSALRGFQKSCVVSVTIQSRCATPVWGCVTNTQRGDQQPRCVCHDLSCPFSPPLCQLYYVQCYYI